MEPAVYRVGETLLAKFDLAGFQLGRKTSLKWNTDYRS